MQFRCARRNGPTDFGASRRRMDGIRQALKFESVRKIVRKSVERYVAAIASTVYIGPECARSCVERRCDVPPLAARRQEGSLEGHNMSLGGVVPPNWQNSRFCCQPSKSGVERAKQSCLSVYALSSIERKREKDFRERAWESNKVFFVLSAYVDAKESLGETRHPPGLLRPLAPGTHNHRVLSHSLSLTLDTVGVAAPVRGPVLLAASLL